MVQILFLGQNGENNKSSFISKHLLMSRPKKVLVHLGLWHAQACYIVHIISDGQNSFQNYFEIKNKIIFKTILKILLQNNVQKYFENIK